MKEIILGREAGTGAAETLHLEDDGRLAMVRGDWLWRAFGRKAGYLVRKNGFAEDDRLEMEARALAAVLSARDGFDEAKATREDGHKRYLNTIVANALVNAAKEVADERGVWSSCLSLDVPLGDLDDGTTHGDMVLANATFAANAKLWSRPCRRAAATDFADPGPAAEPAQNDHDRAVDEMGLADDTDEKPEAAVRRCAEPGFGDAAAFEREAELRLDVALVMARLPPRLCAWCRKVLEGYSPVDAYRSERFSKTGFYSRALPRLRAAFAHLRRWR